MPTASHNGVRHPGLAAARYGEKEVGCVEHRFEPDGLHTREFVRVPALKRLDMADFAAAGYGKLADAT